MTAKQTPAAPKAKYLIFDLTDDEYDVLSKEELFLRVDNWICDRAPVLDQDEAYLDIINDHWLVFEVKPNLSISRVMIEVETPARKYSIIGY